MSGSGLSQKVVFDRKLIDKYDRAGPRYTSYPTAPHFHEKFGPEQFRKMAADSNVGPDKRPLSIYVHIPFCDTVCYYCACNKVVTPDRSRAAHYLEYLFQEIPKMGALFDRDRPVVQLHLGGGTPTYLDIGQLGRLQEELGKHFNLMGDDTGEYGIEVDPREVPDGTLQGLRDLGYNRISIGVQDLDPKVQKAVNRIQPKELTWRVVEESRAVGFHSINLDLIYGLPFQTEAGFTKTLETVIQDLEPDRLAVFNYAHLPQYFMPQRRVNPEELPEPEEKLRILESAIEVLTRAGYVYVGMDHFAKPEDELATAQRNGVLHRNFQGYTTHGECDLVSLGTTAISQVGPSYAQNLKGLEEYYQRLDGDEITVFRGLELTRDDLIRRDVIMRLICDFQLDRTQVGERLNLDFDDYFKDSLPDIARMVDEGLLEDEGSIIRLTPGGRLLIRNVCMAFDWYLKNAEQTRSFSKTI
ncbi:MAG: oxygen-independent coproporphyrinogen III oxidase [Magnetococcales bacterium]|nr:oxygen-independent coproporphyrinogen III oxidase [Magnetococcales bacterium]